MDETTRKRHHILVPKFIVNIPDVSVHSMTVLATGQWSIQAGATSREYWPITNQAMIRCNCVYLPKTMAHSEGHEASMVCA